MAAIIPTGGTVWGFQLPVQSQSSAFVQPWEPEAGADELAMIARAAEDAGAFYIAVCDHVAIPEDAAPVMSTTWYDTVATLGWLAAQTERVHLLSHVYVAPYRHPLATAKAFATLDHLSDGRILLGVGAGHVVGEFELLGADFDARGRTLDAALGILRDAFEEEFVSVPVGEDEATFGLRPRPARPGGPPIWVGGSAPPAIRRAALRGDGWLPQGPPKQGMRAAIEEIRTLRDAAGLPEAFDLGVNCEPVFLGEPTFEVPAYTATGSPDAVAERLRRYPALGCNQLQLRFLGRDASEFADQVERFGAEVAPLLTR